MSTATLKLSGMDEISTLMNSRRRMMMVNTYEEERFLEDLKTVLQSKGYPGYAWSLTGGLRDIITGEQVQKIYDPVQMLDFIQKSDKQSLYILLDFHDIWDNKQAKRKLRDVLEVPDKVYKPIVVLSPQATIPMELEKLVTIVDYELPNREQVIEQLEAMEDMLRSRDLPVPEGRERDAIINSLVGMTITEITNVLKKSVAKNRCIVLNELIAEKEQVIKKTGLLEYVTKLGDMSNVGGMDIVKEWLEDAYYSFDPDARNMYRIDYVRGIVCTGWPGTGKSLLAKSIAAYWNLPLLKMNMSWIMDSKVGQSEKNIERALKLAEAVSPCTLWIDEFEKGLAGLGSSDKSDSGTMARVIQTILTWMSDKESPVFVVATANDITRLPAELTRAGRFDEIFFMSLPHGEEREEILKIHLSKRGYKMNGVSEFAQGVYGEEAIQKLASQMDGFSGAEIEAIVSQAGRRAFASFKKGMRHTHFIHPEDIEEQIERMVPLSRRNPELLQELRSWARTSAKCASSKEHTFLHGESSASSSSKAAVKASNNIFGDIDL